MFVAKLYTFQHNYHSWLLPSLCLLQNSTPFNTIITHDFYLLYVCCKTLHLSTQLSLTTSTFFMFVAKLYTFQHNYHSWLLPSLCLLQNSTPFNTIITHDFYLLYVCCNIYIFHRNYHLGLLPSLSCLLQNSTPFIEIITHDFYLLYHVCCNIYTFHWNYHSWLLPSLSCLLQKLTPFNTIITHDFYLRCHVWSASWWSGRCHPSWGRPQWRAGAGRPWAAQGQRPCCPPPWPPAATGTARSSQCCWWTCTPSWTHHINTGASIHTS